MNQYSTYSCSWVSYLLSTSVTHWTLGSTYQANGIFWQKKKKKVVFSSSSSSWWISEIRILLCFIATTSPIREALSDIMKNGRHPQKIHPWNFSWQENFHNEARSSKLTLVSFHFPINHVECIMNRPFCPCINPGPLMKPAESYLSPWCPSAIVSALNTRICHSLTNTCPTSLSILSLWILLFLYDTYNQM